MKRILIQILTVLALGVVTISCSHPEPVNALFRWEKTEEPIDSVTVALEWAFIEREDSAIIAHLISRYDSVKDAGNQDMALFWKARLMNREHNLPAAKRLLSKALSKCDSISRPYTHTRIKYLMAILSGGSKAELYSSLKEIEKFYSSTHDSFMSASVALDLGHIMRDIGDAKRAIAYYMTADSIYEKIGIDTYHIKTSLNNATIFQETGDTANSRKVISDLLANEKARHDRDFYIDVLLEDYRINGNLQSLLSAWDIIEKRGLDLMDTKRAALELTKYYQSIKDYDKALHYSKYLRLDEGDKIPLPMNAEAHGIMAEIYAESGDKDAALKLYRVHSHLQDSLLRLKTAVEISNLESGSEIARSEAALESRHQIERLWTWILIMAVMMVGLIGAFFLMRKIQSSKLAIARYHLDLERKQRSLVSSALVMEEKDNVLQSVLSNIHKMEAEGRLKRDETRHLEQNVKMHLTGRQDWNQFRELFDNVHPHFHQRLKELYPNLTEGDLRLATYIKTGMQGKQIARMLMLQPDTVRKNRQKLRRHLGMSADESLEDFLRKIDSL